MSSPAQGKGPSIEPAGGGLGEVRCWASRLDLSVLTEGRNHTLRMWQVGVEEEVQSLQPLLFSVSL